MATGIAKIEELEGRIGTIEKRCDGRPDGARAVLIDTEAVSLRKMCDVLEEHVRCVNIRLDALEKRQAINEERPDLALGKLEAIVVVAGPKVRAKSAKVKP